MLHGLKVMLGELGAGVNRGPAGPEFTLLLSLVGIGLSLWLLVLLLKRRRSMLQGREGNRREDPVQTAQGLATAQAELRELVRGFSALADQVVRAVERDGQSRGPADPQGRVLHLLELGLNPTEVARATGLTVGEVALLMNLHKARLGTDRITTAQSSPALSASEQVHDSNGASDDARIAEGES